mgnify:CR=1 FL=1
MFKAVFNGIHRAAAHFAVFIFSLNLMASAHSAYFVEIPNAAAIHIQTSAPGPPSTMAVATPTILPVPIVPASAVIKAENGEISPSPLSVFLDSGLNAALSDFGR